MKIDKCALLLSFCLAAGLLSLAQSPTYQYFRMGSQADATAPATAGFALMGGGSDLDEAFRFLCNKAPGGDFLILRARGDDDYNSYVNGLCRLNSVATLVIPDRQAAQVPRVSDIIRHAEAIFIAGGDQARYINFWQGTPVQDALNANLAAGKPIGGTSAGLAVLGEFIYSAQGDAPDDPALRSGQALADPFMPRVTVRRDFLKIPLLANTLIDTHFAKRDRMGRTLTFLARIMQDGWSEFPREVAIDEKSAVLVEPDGKGTVLGSGKGTYFLRPTQKPEACKKGEPLTIRNISVYRVPAGGHFDLTSWTGDGGTAYSLSVEKGKIDSTQANHAIY